MEHPLTTYIRTKLTFKHRFKGEDDYETVRLYVYELKKLGFNSGPLLYHLKESGQIWYDEKGNFKPLVPGSVDPSLLEITKKKNKESVVLTPLHIYMRDQLMFVDMDTDDPQVSVYFKTFVEQRQTNLKEFFTVDDFSARVHTPIVNLKHDLRKFLKLKGEACVSLDVKQMQPMILGKVLAEAVGKNTFSDAIDDGLDVYVMLQKEANLEARDEAKKLLFRLIFGRPKDDIKKMFSGDTSWVDWINQYKSREEIRNPHKQHTHTNLAWLLQHEEVVIMTEIWEQLMVLNVPFLTIHDDVLVRDRDVDTAHGIMQRVLQKHFSKYQIKITK